MLTTVIFLILLISGWLALLNQKRIIGLTGFTLGLLLYLAVGDGLIPSVLLAHLQAPYARLVTPYWEQRNVIVLLGGGAVKLPHSLQVEPTSLATERLVETVRLYRLCKQTGNSCMVLISGGDTLHIGQSEAKIYAQSLVSLGVTPADMQLETHSLNTYQNAQFTSQFIKANHFQQIYLVTSGIHMPRALLYFANFGIYPQAAPAGYLKAARSPYPLGYNFAMADYAINEYVGMARLYIYNFFGWNEATNSSQE